MSGQWLTLTEQTRQALQEKLDSAKTAQERNRLGQFATPAPLSKQIVSVALSYVETEAIHFLEPALGSGAFYSALLGNTGEKLTGKAVGFEIDQGFSQAAETLWGKSGLTVHNKDFLLAPPPLDEQEKFNLLITNPPYVRHHHLSQQQKEQFSMAVTDTLKLRPSKLMGLYGYFLLLAHDWLRKDGIAAWLIPSEFMDVNYGSAIKKYLTRHVKLLRVHRFEASNVQFTDADVTSTVLFFRNTKPAPDHDVVFSKGADLEKPQNTSRITVKNLRAVSKWSTVGQRPASPIVINSGKQELTIKLEDCFDIKRGLATGANRFFIMTRDQAAQRGIPEKFLKPILPSPRHLRQHTTIEADALGMPLLDQTLVLLDCPLPGKQLLEQYPRLYEYILSGEKMGLPQRYLLSRRSPWYRQEVREAAPLLCGYMGRKNGDGVSIRFYRNKSNAIAANVYHMLYPKPVITRHFEQPEYFFDYIFSKLVELDQREILNLGRSYGGGLDKIEPNELKQIQLPVTDDFVVLYNNLQKPQQIAFSNFAA